MRVINSRQSSPAPRAARKSRKWVVVVMVAVLIGIGSYILVQQQKAPQNDEGVAQQAVNTSNNALQTKSSTSALKEFTGQQFHELYERFVYPNTAAIKETTPITGNIAADGVIRKIAVDRGYALRSAPVTDAFQEVEPTMKLQQRAAQPWLDLKATAKKDGVNIGLSAAYRSADEQRDIFMERLNEIGVSTQAIAAGSADTQVSQVLRMTAIPGYSRHHNGYTIDIACLDEPTTSFSYTTCFEWLSAQNYLQTKKHGWIPSYPEGSGPQGPDPESWEYVWVGTAPLTQ